jgi:hypothetical protein
LLEPQGSSKRLAEKSFFFSFALIFAQFSGFEVTYHLSGRAQGQILNIHYQKFGVIARPGVCKLTFFWLFPGFISDHQTRRLSSKIAGAY